MGRGGGRRKRGKRGESNNFAEREREKKEGFGATKGGCRRLEILAVCHGLKKATQQYSRELPRYLATRKAKIGRRRRLRIWVAFSCKLEFKFNFGAFFSLSLCRIAFAYFRYFPLSSFLYPSDIFLRPEGGKISEENGEKGRFDLDRVIPIS